MFVKGQSGNPGGRPKSNVVAMARLHTAEAIEALVNALGNPKERVPAAIALLDRGWGKALQQVQALDENGEPMAAVPAMRVVVELVGEPAAPRQSERQVGLALADDIRRNVKLVG
jgi:hypothetical protein